MRQADGLRTVNVRSAKRPSSETPAAPSSVGSTGAPSPAAAGGGGLGGGGDSWAQSAEGTAALALIQRSVRRLSLRVASRMAHKGTGFSEPECRTKEFRNAYWGVAADDESGHIRPCLEDAGCGGGERDPKALLVFSSWSSAQPVLQFPFFFFSRGLRRPL